MDYLTPENIIEPRKNIKNRLLLLIGIFKPKSWFFFYHYIRGLKFTGGHKYKKAIGEFEVCLLLAEGNIYALGLVYIRLGICYFDISINDKAKYYFLKGLEISPKDKDERIYGSGPEITSRLGVIYAEEGDYNKAKEYLESARQLKPRRFTKRSYTNWEMVDRYLLYINEMKPGETGDGKPGNQKPKPGETGGRYPKGHPD